VLIRDSMPYQNNKRGKSSLLRICVKSSLNSQYGWRSIAGRCHDPARTPPLINSYPPSQQSESPPSPHYSKDSCTKPPLGGGTPAPTAASGAVQGAEAPPEATPTVTKGRWNRLTIASCPPVVYTVVSGENGFLSSPRSRRKKRFSDWCSIEQD
jgi:hypothetical protein